MISVIYIINFSLLSSRRVQWVGYMLTHLVRDTKILSSLIYSVLNDDELEQGDKSYFITSWNVGTEGQVALKSCHCVIVSKGQRFSIN
jgi:hypothetical protein